MKIYKCDRCGKVIDEGFEGIKDNIDGSPSITVFKKDKEVYADICNDCYREFRTWMDIERRN